MIYVSVHAYVTPIITKSLMEDFNKDYVFRDARKITDMKIKPN